MTEAAGELGQGRPVEIRFQDEVRIGQKGILERVWASKKMRPPIERDDRYGYCYLLAAHCASRGEAAGLVASKPNTGWMIQRLAAIGEEVIGIVVLDRAG